ncbi:hypothetical protein [Hymenobacter chitinivorans]|uniref:Oxygen tolerance protein BatD n=1 Tax=Hymenobacter chitinivorans DSM 11115 TaxID=1121954 RepID=A0A2M9BT47_9BACT|nr:hypothetical protein [Hymenobacter chitinivorans]PJJ61129.1 hypothetical protein CLV45_2567 [Hymenobacter chitinivorans DSM 11115]
MRRFSSLFLGLALLLSHAAAAVSSAEQDVPRSRFMRPGTRVGEIIDYELSYAHAPDLEVIFPDSTAEFKPFEYVGKTFYPTRTRRGQSIDRTVYHLRTFALDSVQRLSLPVTILRGNDTVAVASTAAVVRLLRTATVAAGAAQAPVLQQNTTPLPVPTQFNYPYWLAGAGVLALALGGFFVGFRRTLRLRYQRYRLRKNHVYFLAQYARHIERFTLSRSLTNMERAITLWKNYLTGLEDNTINSLTTREIVAHYENDHDVNTALRITDRVIYGNQFSEEEAETDMAFVLLRDFAERRYELVSARLRA